MVHIRRPHCLAQEHAFRSASPSHAAVRLVASVIAHRQLKQCRLCPATYNVLHYPKGCAAPGDVRCQCNTRGLLSKLEKIPPQRKIHVTSKSPVGDISDVTLIRTDTTLDHSQKAEKVCRNPPILSQLCQQTGVGHVSAKNGRAC